MTLNSKTLAVLLVVIMFGGIAISAALGWWQTSSDKMPALYTEGEFAGEANPADIRGSYTFGDIAHVFNITPAILAKAFGVTADDPAAFQVKDLETIYADNPVEIGTASVRLFVAFYLGLPYDLTGAEETYLPQTAVDVLTGLGTLTPEQLAWLQTHTASGPGLETAPEPDSVTEATPTPHTPSADSAYMVKGKTTFGELVAWGVTKETIEKLINAPMPDPAITVKDYASQNGLNFETLKPALQEEVDKVRK